MASTIIHMAVANEINKRIKRKNPEYLIGSIAPDIGKIVGIDKDITHFQTNGIGYPNLDLFLSKYEKDLNNDFVMGYYIHLLTDYFWFKYFYTEIVNDNTITKLDGSKIKLSQEEIDNLIYNDYTNLNVQVIEKYNLNLKIFYNEIPNIESTIEEIPMDKIDKLIEKMGIIIENSTNDKNYVFNIKDIETFINTCTELILSILEEKKLLTNC